MVLADLASRLAAPFLTTKDTKITKEEPGAPNLPFVSSELFVVLAELASGLAAPFLTTKDAKTTKGVAVTPNLLFVSTVLFVVSES